ncbi:hypothetical protein CPC08DRAFT_717555 [Agrocybe pediades]|nr:hypothetical protein CPC08DRAFT_717555 [Agrocybe pediades]
MLTPDRQMPHMLPLDPQPPFIPPPLGSTHGGEGHYNPFPGAARDGDEGGFGHAGSSAPWGPPPAHGTPYPTYHQLQQASSAGTRGGWPTTPLSPGGPPWGYQGGGAYPPAPLSAPVAPSNTWGIGGGWGHSPTAGVGGGGGGGWAPNPNLVVHNAFPGYTQQGPQTFTPYTPNQQAMPGTPYESISGQPVTAGWFGAGAGGGGGAEAMGGGWFANAEPKKKKKSSHHGHGHGHSDGHHVHAFDMRRSSSQVQAPKRPALKRAASWGNGSHSPYLDPNYNYFGNKVHNVPRPPTPQTPGYMQIDHFDENNLARRPRDWRPDYVAKSGIAGLIPSVLGMNSSTVKDYSDPIRRTLHPLLAYKSTNPPFYYDLRLPGFSPEHVSFEPLLNRPANEIDYHQLALQPTCSFMRIYHPKLPWFIDVHQVHPNGITVIDVLQTIAAQLHMSIHGRHYWNDELGDAERKSITLAFQDRTRGQPVEVMQRGILQVDYLGKKCVLEGFVRGGKGLWEMKTRRPDD